jgi:leader peptidase (prepilin peptidase)/N-methyltransferase
MTGTLVLPGMLGAVIGSFLNVVALRLPRGQSLLRPASHCPGCGAAVRPWHNVPILGWLALRGRCHDCGRSISPRYPLVEAATAALYVAVILHTGLDRDAVLPLLLVTALVPIALTDLDHRIIPNAITGPAAAVGLVAALLVDPSGVPERLIAAAAAGGAFLAVALAVPGGMGMGDVKLVALLGLYLGASVAPALLVALLAGSLAGGVVMARRGVRAGRKTAIPFGPFLVLGGLTAIFVGSTLIDHYRHGF